MKLLLINILLLNFLLVGCGKISSSAISEDSSYKTYNYLLVESESGPHKIHGYEVNGNGGLTSLSSSPLEIDLTKSPASIETHPNGKFLVFGYVTSGLRFISIYSIDQSTGALTQVGGPVQLTQESTNSSHYRWLYDITFHPNGRFLYVRADKLHTFSFSETGSIQLVGTPSTIVSTMINSYDSKMVINTDGTLLYVSSLGNNGNVGEVYAYSIDPNTGLLTRIAGEETTGGFGTGASMTTPLTLSPDNKFLYIGIKAANSGIKIRPIGTNGALETSPNNTPTSGISHSRFMAFVNGGTHFVSSSEGSLKCYTQDKVTGALTATTQGSIAIGNSLESHLLNQDNDLLYVSNVYYSPDDVAYTSIHSIQFSADGTMTENADQKVELQGVGVQMAQVRILN